MSAGIDALSYGKVSTDNPYVDSIHHLRSVGSLRRGHGLGRPAQIRRQGEELEPARPIVHMEHSALWPDRAVLRAAARCDSRLALVAARRDLRLLFLVCRIHGRMGVATGARRVPMELRPLPVQPARADPVGFLSALVRLRNAAGISERPADNPDAAYRRGVQRVSPGSILCAPFDIVSSLIAGPTFYFCQKLLHLCEIAVRIIILVFFLPGFIDGLFLFVGQMPRERRVGIR